MIELHYCILDHLHELTINKMKNIEYFKKVYIKDISDLPKEDGVYFVAGKNTLKTSGLKPKIFTVISKDVWLRYIEWYLLPVSLPTDEEIEHHIYGIYGDGAFGETLMRERAYIAGATWMRNKLQGL